MLPSISGIDTRVGLDNCGDNPALYRRLLLRFASAQQDFPAQFTAAKKQADANAATRCAHNLKSTAGSLGILEVQSLAGELERACKDNADPEPVDRLVTQIAALLDTLIPPLLEYGKQGDKSNAAVQTTSHWDHDKVLATLDRLKQLIENYEAEALDVAMELTRVASLEPSSVVLQQICAALEEFDFAEAESLVDGLREGIAEESG